MSDDIVRSLRGEGYAVAEGAADVLNLIHAVSDDSTQPRCSSFRVFPDGKKCKGCADCGLEHKADLAAIAAQAASEKGATNEAELHAPDQPRDFNER